MSFKQVNNIKEYVGDLHGNVYDAYKFGVVIAHQVDNPEGVQLTTYTSDGEVETVNTAVCGDWIVTHASSVTGRPILNEQGNPNSWIVTDAVFKKKYDQKPLANGTYRPVGVITRFMQIDQDISFIAPWGEIQNIKAGGFLNIENLDDIYGIAKDEFYSTYRVGYVVALADRAMLEEDKAAYPGSFTSNI